MTKKPDPVAALTGLRPMTFRLCQYPHGDAQHGFRFCEAPITHPTGPYCNTHRAACYEDNSPSAEKKWLAYVLRGL